MSFCDIAHSVCVRPLVTVYFIMTRFEEFLLVLELNYNNLTMFTIAVSELVRHFSGYREGRYIIKRLTFLCLVSTQKRIEKLKVEMRQTLPQLLSHRSSRDFNGCLIKYKTLYTGFTSKGNISEWYRLKCFNYSGNRVQCFLNIWIDYVPILWTSHYHFSNFSSAWCLRSKYSI